MAAMNNESRSVHPVVFRSSSGRYYAYDPFTNRILTIDSSKYQGVDEATAAQDILRYLEESGICKTGSFSGAKWKNPTASGIRTKPNTLVLQLSCRCNLACEYCIYSGNYSHMQEHHDEDMSTETLIRSIDYFAENSADEGKLKIAFYGGEALLCFDKIRDAVSYARKKMPKRQLLFSISTNGTTLTPEVVRWLSGNPDAKATITINGYDHDRYRKTTSGKGSLKIIIDRLEYIKANYPDVWRNQISCIANKVSDAENEAIMDYYKEHIGMPPEAVTKIREDMGNEKIADILSGSHPGSQGSDLYERYITGSDPFVDAFYDPKVFVIHDRRLYSGDDSAYVPSCVPTATRIFVRADGSMNICERVSDQLCIGGIDSGFDEPKLHSLCQEFTQFVGRNCLDCWAQRLCAFCYQDVIDEKGNMIESFPEAWCENSRKGALESLVLYCDLAENRYSHLGELNP